MHLGSSPSFNADGQGGATAEALAQLLAGGQSALSTLDLSSNCLSGTATARILHDLANSPAAGTGGAGAGGAGPGRHVEVGGGLRRLVLRDNQLHKPAPEAALQKVGGG